MFNLKELELNKKRAAQNLGNSEFYHFICKDIIERISDIKGNFDNILVINAPIRDKMQSLIEKRFMQSNVRFISVYNNKLESAKYDMIIFPFGLHWCFDVQNFLREIKNSLTENGIFIANFAGGGSLQNLRRKLIEVESLCATNHTPHIIPFIRFDDMVLLLQQAGYSENIIDMELLELIYQSPLALMRDLKKYGDSNILRARANYAVNKKIYHELNRITEKSFMDQVNLITFISAINKGTIKLL